MLNMPRTFVALLFVGSFVLAVSTLIAGISSPDHTPETTRSTKYVPPPEPRFEDFTPLYECPWFGEPLSCHTPVKMSVDCTNVRTIPQRMGPFSPDDVRNTDKACELLPAWLDQDPRIIVVPQDESDVHLVYEFFPFGGKFLDLYIHEGDTRFAADYFNDEDFPPGTIIDKRAVSAANYVQQSLKKLERKGYLP